MLAGKRKYHVNAWEHRRCRFYGNCVFISSSRGLHEVYLVNHSHDTGTRLTKRFTIFTIHPIFFESYGLSFETNNKNSGEHLNVAIVLFDDMV